MNLTLADAMARVAPTLDDPTESPRNRRPWFRAWKTTSGFVLACNVIDDRAAPTGAPLPCRASLECWGAARRIDQTEYEASPAEYVARVAGELVAEVVKKLLETP